MIFYEKNIILDEVHEASMDMSIAKALLQHRKGKGEDINIIEMSATINLEKQQQYWANFNPMTFESEGRTFDCEIIEDNSKVPAEHAVDLILNKARKGVAVFESGVANIEETREKIEEILLSKNIKDIDVAMIYGEMDKKERDQALKAPQSGNKKIIIGTNVIESGMNIPWLDAGVTSGNGKDLFVTSSGAIALKEQNLPQWRLQQQKGRVARFSNGIFVLASYAKWADRNKETIPEISRLPLSSLIMDCASFGLKAEDLNFDAEINYSQLLLAKEKLQRLKLIDEEGKLTKLGKFSNDLPVTVDNAVVLKYAQSREYCLNQALVMVAVSEQGNMRQNFRESHGQDRYSDLFDGMKAFIAVDKEIRNLKQMLMSKKVMENNIDGVFAKYNVSKKRFYETKELVRDIRSRLNVRFSTSELTFDYDKLKQCLIAGNIEKLNIHGRNIFNGDGYNISNSSVVFGSSNIFLAEPRVITPKNGGRSFTVNEKVTALDQNDIKKYISKNSDVIAKVDSDGDFGILDSLYISDDDLRDFVKDGFNKKINDAMTILKNDGIEGFKDYTIKNPIPEVFWKKAINAESGTDAICEVLSQNKPVKENNLYEILGIEEGHNRGNVTITEDDLKFAKNFEKEIEFNNTKINEIRTGDTAKLRGNNLYVTITDDGNIIQTNRHPNEDREDYQAILAQISDIKSIYDVNAEELLKDSKMSDGYKQKIHLYIENKIKEQIIIERREKLRNLGMKVADSVQPNEIENVDYKRISKILSQLEEFKDFAKGDISEEEFNIYVMKPVEDKKEDVYEKILKENADKLKSEISNKGKIEDLKAKLAEKYGLSIRDIDIERIQQENIKEEQEAEKQKKLSHVEEVAADKLIEFLENDDGHGFNYFASVNLSRRNVGYEVITRNVMQELGFEISDDDIDDESREIQDVFFKIKEDVENLQKETQRHSYFDREENVWVDGRYDFLAVKAGYEPATKEKKGIDNNKIKKEVSENNKGETVILGLDALAALKDRFNVKR